MLAGGGYWFANYQADKKLLASEVRIQKMLVEMKQRTNENAELQSELKKTKSHLEAFEESFNELKNVFFQEQEVRIQREQTINLLESKCSK